METAPQPSAWERYLQFVSQSNSRTLRHSEPGHPWLQCEACQTWHLPLASPVGDLCVEGLQDVKDGMNRKEVDISTHANLSSNVVAGAI